MNRDGKYTYVTLLGTDDYVIGTLCLATSLKRVASKYPLLVLCSRGVSDSTVDLLKQKGIECRILNQSVTVENVNTGKFERWNYTFDKLQAFSLTEYEKVLFLDSDMFVVKNMDHLFEKPHMSAVYADVWDETASEGLNSGLMVIEPAKSVYEGLVSMLYSDRFNDSKMFGDQDIIRAYFDDWMSRTECRLPIGYNLYYPCVKFF